MIHHPKFTASPPAAATDCSNLEHWGYTEEKLLFLGLSTMRGFGFAGLKRLGGPAGIAEHLQGKGRVDLYETSVGRVSKSSPGARKKPGYLDREALLSKGMILAKNLVRDKIRLLTLPEMPPAVRELPPAMQPAWLFVQGEVTLLWRPSVAIVGTRKPSPTGEFLTKYIVGLAGTLNVPVVSGLAHGIDSIAHQACVEIDLPTISVLGSGLLSLYPAKNRELADRILAQGGTLVSEYLPGQQPTAASFVWRNRLQACLANVVVATEWKMKSGTAHTMRFAKQFHRPNASIRLSRVKHESDAGQAEINLDIPRQHDLLLQVLREALGAPYNGPRV